MGLGTGSQLLTGFATVDARGPGSEFASRPTALDAPGAVAIRWSDKVIGGVLVSERARVCHGRLIRRGAAIDDARVRGVRERNAARARNGSILLFARGSLFSASSFVNILGHTKSM